MNDQLIRSSAKILFLGLLLFLPGSFCLAQDHGGDALQNDNCSRLTDADWTDSIDEPLDIYDAHSVDSPGERQRYCFVRGYVWPQVQFQLVLPAAGWNGKFIEFGCGGTCGIMPQASPEGSWCHNGYACIFTDLGHEGNAFDGLWAYHNAQAHYDFGSRATHVTAVAGKAITARYYGRAANYSYFYGCSLGSEQGLIEAQRYPGDFNGIVGGGATIGETALAMDLVWGARALRGEDGKPLLSQEDMKMVHDAVLARCDMDDGVRDGLIGNPLACKFDPAELECRMPARKSGCLTHDQVEALKKVYAGPTTSSGIKLSSGGTLPGSEHEWITDSSRDHAVGEWIMSDGSTAEPEQFANLYFRWLARPSEGPGWNVAALDFDRDYVRFADGAKEPLIDDTNPDLRRFNASGGKLLLYVGWKEWTAPRNAIDYYNTVERVIGGPDATRRFFRLFIVPGANHCGSGEGAWAVNYQAYMEDWVENGRAPDRLIGAHVSGNRKQTMNLRFPLKQSEVSFTRPIYPYPLWAKYSGRGDPNKAENFKPAAP